jgi:hypothetical protein
MKTPNQEKGNSAKARNRPLSLSVRETAGFGAIQSTLMVQACIRQPSGVKVSNHDRLFTQPLAAGKAGWRFQFRFAVHAGWSRVPELWTLGPQETMPQVHFVISRELAHKTASAKIWPAPDDAGAIVSAHLVIEALLYAFIRSRLANREALDSASLRFHQTLCLARALKRKLKGEDWLWSTLDQLNRTRNRLSHDIHVTDLPARIEQLYAAAGDHIQIHAPRADPKEREENRLKYFLLILCGVVQNLRREKKKK